MKFLRTLLSCALLVGASGMASAADAASGGSFNVLVFSKTNGFRHKDAIAAGVPFFQKMGELLNFSVDASEDASVFTDERLRKYQAIVLLNTTGEFTADKCGKSIPAEEKKKLVEDSLARQEAFRKWVENGGAIVGLHSATDCFHEGTSSIGAKRWPEFQKIIGGAFASHPHHQICDIEIVDAENPSVKALANKVVSAEEAGKLLGKASTVTRNDKGLVWRPAKNEEWYFFKYLQRDNHVILNVDDSTVKRRGKNSYDEVVDGKPVACPTHPFAWTREYGKGKIFYTARGHYGYAFAEPEYALHVLTGLFMVVGKPLPNIDITAQVSKSRSR
ncbi:MAG: ThuA domain-containing protein [Puniceicoccales bacterium]|jgi:type 1 glutamine amidotransferase|nr:ThuA domain-containing protein [Puniceicoccales bacterium]